MTKRQAFVISALLSLTLSTQATFAAEGTSSRSKLTVLMLNDVYQEAPFDNGQRGGFARVATLKNQIKSKQPQALFLLAGDTISPSVASRTFKGKQMIAGWNALGLDYATLGNHEFDFGPDVLLQRISESKFKWICANIIDKRTNKPFANLDRYVIRDIDGVKVGIFGLITPDTLKCSQTGPNIDILDPCETAKQVVPEMRAKGAEVIIALTHLSMTQDKAVTHCVPIDLVVGGHEHTVLQAISAGAAILKAGSDAVNLGRIDITVNNPAHKVDSIDWQLLPITSALPDDPAVIAVVNTFESQLKAELNTTIGKTSVELDATQLDNQTKETNLSDFIADAYREATGSDVALVNGGSIRSNTIYGAGDLTRGNILSILPFENPIVKLQVPGATIRQALEHGLANVGIKDGGAFPQVSGMTYTYDAGKAPGSRLVEVTIQGQPLDDKREYTLATNGFVTTGGDGYNMFKNAKYLSDMEDGNSESVVLLNAIAKAKVIAPQVDGRIKRVER